MLVFVLSCLAFITVLVSLSTYVRFLKIVAPYAVACSNFAIGYVSQMRGLIESLLLTALSS